MHARNSGFALTLHASAPAVQQIASCAPCETIEGRYERLFRAGTPSAGVSHIGRGSLSAMVPMASVEGTIQPLTSASAIGRPRSSIRGSRNRRVKGSLSGPGFPPPSLSSPPLLLPRPSTSPPLGPSHACAHLLRPPAAPLRVRTLRTGALRTRAREHAAVPAAAAVTIALLRSSSAMPRPGTPCPRPGVAPPPLCHCACAAGCLGKPQTPAPHSLVAVNLPRNKTPVEPALAPVDHTTQRMMTRIEKPRESIQR